MQLAQVLKFGENEGGTPIELKGPLDPNKFPNLASVVTNALQFIFPIAGVLLLLYLVWGGFSYLTSIGDPKKAEAARGRITNAIIGFVLIFAAFWLVQILEYVFRLR